MVPSLTETLIECGVEVIGRTRFCVHPLDKVSTIPVVGGTKEINWGDGADAKMGLIISVLLIQLIAIPGSIALSKISELKGNLFALKLVLFLWVVLCFCAGYHPKEYVHFLMGEEMLPNYIVSEPFDFYCIAGFVGLVMGGIQSLSRSTFSKFIPQETKDTSSYFSFYAFTLLFVGS